jgi:hypothetical protein
MRLRKRVNDNDTSKAKRVKKTEPEHECRRNGAESFIGRRAQRRDKGVWITGIIKAYNTKTTRYTIIYDNNPKIKKNELWSAEHRLLHMDDSVDHYTSLMTHKSNDFFCKLPGNTEEQHPKHDSKTRKHRDVKNRANRFIGYSALQQIAHHMKKIVTSCPTMPSSWMTYNALAPKLYTMPLTPIAN